MRQRTLAYVGIALVLTGLAALEFFAEYLHGDAPDPAVCLTPESRKDAIREVLLHHMLGH